MTTILAVALLLATPAAPALANDRPAAAATVYQPRIIQPADARADIALMRRGLETVHPGLYRYTPKSGIDAAFARLEAAASRPLSELALHREISLMLSAIHCDHTKAEMSATLDEWRRTQPTHLPFRFALIEGRMIVVSNDGQVGAPPRGAEVLEINGRAVPVLMNELGRAVAYDGDTDQTIAVKLADDSDLMGDDFNEYYPSFYGFPSTWAIAWKRPGETATKRATLVPIDFLRWTKLDAPAGPYRDEFYKAVTWRMAGKVARLRIGTFVNYRNPVDATTFLGGFFKTMKARGTEHLILDLRDNGGGSEDVSVALGRYLFDKPFLWSKPVLLKSVRYGDLPKYVESWGDPVDLYTPPLDRFRKTADGWFERIPVAGGADKDDSTVPQAPLSATERFAGKLTILTGPRNGSGATRTIAKFKEERGATLIGEDSAGSAEGPTAGRIFLMTLPASGLKVRIPNAWNRTNLAQFAPRLGVPVDRLVVPTLADFDTGRDAAVDAAAKTQAPTPDPAMMLAQAFGGRWRGTLDYRDYQTDGRTTLPVTLEADAGTLRWNFNDGPSKQVAATETWTVDPSGKRVTIAGSSGTESFRVAQAETTGDGKGVTLVFDGVTIENDRPKLTRLVLSSDATTLRLTKMTRERGQPFSMRNAYHLVR